MIIMERKYFRDSQDFHFKKIEFLQNEKSSLGRRSLAGEIKSSEVIELFNANWNERK